MKYAYKTEIKPTDEQMRKIRRSIGICRWLYNEYLDMNKRLYRMYQRGLLDSRQSYFITANDFDKYVNNKLKVKPEYSWINQCGSKARKKVLINAEAAFRNFFAGNTAFPAFKRKTDEDVKLYFPKNNPGDWIVERHRIKIPTLKYVRLKEYGYLPTNVKVINGNVSYRAGRFYVSITVEKNPEADYKPICRGIGLNIKILDIKDAASIKVADLQKRLQVQQKKLDRKYRQNGKADGSIKHANREKQRRKIKRIEQKINFIREDYINKCVAEIVDLKPKYIVVEKLNVDNMVVSKELRKYSAKQKYYFFKNRLLIKCSKYNIELKQAEDVAKFAETVVPVEII